MCRGELKFQSKLVSSDVTSNSYLCSRWIPAGVSLCKFKMLNSVLSWRQVCTLSQVLSWNLCWLWSRLWSRLWSWLWSWLCCDGSSSYLDQPWFQLVIKHDIETCAPDQSRATTTTTTTLISSEWDIQQRILYNSKCVCVCVNYSPYSSKQCLSFIITGWTLKIDLQHIIEVRVEVRMLNISWSQFRI